MAALRDDAAVRRRLAFIAQIAVSGLRWAKTPAEHVHLLLGLVVLAAGVTVGGVLLHRPAWFLGVFATILLLLILGEGAYRVWREAESRDAHPQRDRAEERAEAQLAAAIQSGHVLHSLASERLGRLDDLAGHVRISATRLMPSQSWDHHVLVMRSFRDCLAIETREGKQIRADFFNGSDVADNEMVTAWLREVDKTFELAPELRPMAISPYPPGTAFSYEGLSAEISDRLDASTIDLRH